MIQDNIIQENMVQDNMIQENNVVTTENQEIIIDEELSKLDLEEKKEPAVKTTPPLVRSQSQVFGAIVDFVICLQETFGEQYREIELYATLLESTRIIHQEHIRKHIEIFSTFLQENQSAICQNNIEMITSKIIYNEKVFIDIKQILLTNESNENVSIIMQHLLTLMALTCPDSQAQSILVKKSKEKNSLREDNVLEKMFHPREGTSHGNASGNPLQMLDSLFEGNPALGNMVKNITGNLVSNDGGESGQGPSIDNEVIQNMFSGIQTMIGQLSDVVKDHNQV